MKLYRQSFLKYWIILFSVFIANNALLAQSSNNASLICNAGWKRTAWTVMPAMQYNPYWPVASDLFQYEKECKKDDYYVFSSNSTYQLLNGINKCADGESDLISSGKWAFLITDNRILNMVRNGGSFQKQIELSNEKMVWITYQVKNGVKYTFRETFIPL